MNMVIFQSCLELPEGIKQYRFGCQLKPSSTIDQSIGQLHKFQDIGKSQENVRASWAQIAC